MTVVMDNPAGRSYQHTPAMLAEVLTALNCQSGQIVVDGTLGGGGHAREICRIIHPEGHFIGIDRDAAAIAHAQHGLQQPGVRPGVRIDLFQASFSELPVILEKLGLVGVDGILLDLGMSQYQIMASGRGFSFMRDEPLDMRMDTRQELTAARLLHEADVATLADIFYHLGEERYARRIARAIVARRSQQPLNTSGELARLVMDIVPGPAARHQRKHLTHPAIHPATRVFMALRIAVNNELAELETFLNTVRPCLNSGGRIVVLAFHSLEDRIVKNMFRTWEQGCVCSAKLPGCVCGNRPQGFRVVRKALRPQALEVKNNPMARSTRLRVFEVF